MSEADDAICELCSVDCAAVCEQLQSTPATARRRRALLLMVRHDAL